MCDAGTQFYEERLQQVFSANPVNMVGESIYNFEIYGNYLITVYSGECLKKRFFDNPGMN